MTVKLVICKDSDEMARRGAAETARIAQESVQRNGQFNIALAGGSTPEKMYKLLVAEDDAFVIDWSKVRIFFGDERYVPQSDEKQSNFAMARRSLLSSDKVKPENVFAFDTSLPTVQASASAYEKLLTEQLGEAPVFDLILLGMGDDGHTASLFPDAGSLTVMERLVVDSPPGILPPPVDRMTVTVPILQNARNVLLLIGGEKKAQALKDVLENDASVQKRPVSAVKKSAGNVVFMLDEQAAGLLSEELKVSQ